MIAGIVNKTVRRLLEALGRLSDADRRRQGEGSSGKEHHKLVVSHPA
jgi:hypothetical protein